MKKLACVLSLLLVHQLGEVLSQTPLSCGSSTCGYFTISDDGDTKTYTQSRTACSQDGGDLLLVWTSTELGVVQRYLEVFGDDGEYLWTGYQYSTSQGEFVGVDGEGAPSTVTDNIGSTSGAGEDDLCLSVGSDGMFRNDSCSSTLRYICLVEYEALDLTATISPQSDSLQSGTMVTFNCSTVASSPSDLLIRVLREGSEDFESLSEASGVAMLSYEFEFDANQEGSYECVASNPIGTALSQLYSLDIGTNLSSSPPAISTLDLSYGNESGLDNSEIRTVPFGEEITISCGFTSGASASWYINGQEMDATTSSAQSSTLTTTLEVGGMYQCRVTDDSTGLSAVESFTLFGADGTPGPVRFITASPSTQTSIQVSWFPPHFLAVNDPALLRYQLAYNTEDTFKRDDDSTWFLSSEILPHTDESGATTNNLGSLSPGVKYSIAILARSSTGDISTPRYVASALTFGLVPTDDIQNLVVNRSADNKTIVAFWDPITVSVTYQPVEFYEFQYRDAEIGGAENTGAVIGLFSYAVIPNVLNAAAYEFRVRAAYEISDEPKYEYSEWTPWTKVAGITTEIPSIPPKPLSPGDDLTNGEVAVIVVASVIVAVAVVALILAVLLYVLLRSKSKTVPVMTEEKEMIRIEEEKEPVSP